MPSILGTQQPKFWEKFSSKFFCFIFSVRIILLPSAINTTHFGHVLRSNVSWPLVNSHVVLEFIVSLLLVVVSLLIFIYHLNFQFARFWTRRLAHWIIRLLLRNIAVLITRKMDSLFSTRCQIRSGKLTSIVLSLTTISWTDSCRWLNFIFAYNIGFCAPSFWSAIIHLLIRIKSCFIKSLREFVSAFRLLRLLLYLIF